MQTQKKDPDSKGYLVRPLTNSLERIVKVKDEAFGTPSLRVGN